MKKGVVAYFIRNPFRRTPHVLVHQYNEKLLRNCCPLYFIMSIHSRWQCISNRVQSTHTQGNKNEVSIQLSIMVMQVFYICRLGIYGLAIVGVQKVFSHWDNRRQVVSNLCEKRRDGSDGVYGVAGRCITWTATVNRLVWLTFVFQQAPNFSVQLKLFVCSPWDGTLVLGWLAIRARSGRMLGSIVSGISSGRDCIDHLKRWCHVDGAGKHKVLSRTKNVVQLLEPLNNVCLYIYSFFKR